MRVQGVVLFVAILVFAGWARAGDDPALGKKLFEQKCTACHSIGGGPRVGPDLQGVTERRSEEWILRFVSDPGKLIAEKDPSAVALYERFNRIIMPKLGLSDVEARALIAHLKVVGGSANAARVPVADFAPAEMGASQARVFNAFLVIAAVIMLTFAWVGFSTRQPVEVDVKKAYGVRKALFAAALVAAVGFLALTLPGAPYAVANAKPDRVVYVTARQFEFMFSDEPITSATEVGKVPTLPSLELPAGASIEFRVTSIDVNHGFGLYGPERQLVAQTQAMPGYVNAMRVRLTEPGQYKALCLEYCAAGHHAMRSEFLVK